MATATAFTQYSSLPERTVGASCCLSNGHAAAAAGSTGFGGKTVRSERRSLSLNTTSLGSIFGFRSLAGTAGRLAKPTVLYFILL